MSEIQESLTLLNDTLVGKNQDYTAGRGEFYNFERSAEFVNIPPLKAILVEVAKKMTRVESLLMLINQGVMPSNESLKDSILDGAGYLVIAHAYLSAYDSNEENEGDDCECCS